MALCEYCGQEMLDPKTTTCTKDYLVINGRTYERNSSYFDSGERCHDCNIVNKLGNVHHWGCDVEQCPACGGQLISCPCHVEALRMPLSLKK